MRLISSPHDPRFMYRMSRWFSVVALLALLASCASKPITQDDAVIILSGAVTVDEGKYFPYSAADVEIEDEQTQKSHRVMSGYLWEDQCNRPGLYFSKGVCYRAHKLVLPPGRYRIKGYIVWADAGLYTFRYRQPHWNHRFTAAKGEVVYLGQFTYNYKRGTGHSADSMRNSYFSVADNLTMDKGMLEDGISDWPVRRALPPASSQ